MAKDEAHTAASTPIKREADQATQDVSSIKLKRQATKPEQILHLYAQFPDAARAGNFDITKAPWASVSKDFRAHSPALPYLPNRRKSQTLEELLADLAQFEPQDHTINCEVGDTLISIDDDAGFAEMSVTATRELGRPGVAIPHTVKTVFRLIDGEWKLSFLASIPGGGISF